MQHGEVLMLNELQALETPWRKCVRITGTVVSADLHRKECFLYHKGCCVRVDTSLVDPALTRVDSMCQIIGEIRQEGTAQGPLLKDQIPGLYIKASIARNVDGLDLDLLEQALVVRRNFLKEQMKEFA